MLFFLFAAGAQATVTESEPNNNPGEANSVPLDESAVGDCSSGADYLDVYFAAPGWGRANYTLTPSSFSFTLRMDAPNGTTLRANPASGSGTLGFQVATAGNYSFSVTCNAGAAGWIFTFSYSSTGGPIEGAGESEPNNEAGSASNASAGTHAGVLDAVYDPWDYWVVALSQDSAVEIRVESNATPAPSIWQLGNYSEIQEEAGARLFVATARAPGLKFAVQSGGISAGYNLTVRIESDATKFFAGTSEVEPNNNNDLATHVETTTNVTLSGKFDLTHDQVDVFLLQYPAASMVSVDFTRTPYCFYCDDSVRLLRSTGLPALDEFDDPIEGTSFEFGAVAGALYYLEVKPDYSGGSYEITLNRTLFPLLPGSVVSFLDGKKDGYLSALGQGDPGDTPLSSVNLALGGNGTLYGKSILIGISNSAPVSLQVRFPAGLLLEDLLGDVYDYVVTRNQSFTVPAVNYSEFLLVAVKTRTGGHAPSQGTFFTVKGMADGKLANITAETAGGAYGYQAEIIAVWAGSAGVSRADIEAYGANTASINEAGALLNKLGIVSSISTGEQPANTNTNNGGSSNSGAGSGSLLLPLVVVAVLGAVIGLALVLRRRKPAQSMPPMSGPMGPAGAQMPWQAGAVQPPSPAAQPPAYGPRPAPAQPAQPAQYYGPRPAPAYGAQPYYAPQSWVQQSATDPNVIEEVIVVGPDPNTMCPKCSQPRTPGATYCLSCGEFFVR